MSIRRASSQASLVHQEPVKTFFHLKLEQNANRLKMESDATVK